MNWGNGEAAGRWERCGGLVDCLRAVGHDGDCRPRLRAVLLAPAACARCGVAVYWGRRRSWRDLPPRWRDMGGSIHHCAV